MFQGEYSQLLEDLSLEKTGQIIVDAIGKLLNIDIAILHFNKLQPKIEKYFFYQRSGIKPRLERELLKLTVLSDSKQAFDDILKIERYELDKDPLPAAHYQACTKANIRYILFIPLFSQANLTASLTIHSLVEGNCWQESEIEAAKIIATQANLLISQILIREKLQELAHRETTVNRITATIRSSLQPPVMFAAIATELGEALKVDGCTLSLWTKNDRFVKCVGLYNPKEPQVIKHTADWQQTTSKVPIAENPLLQALLFTKKTVSSSDLQKPSSLVRYELPWHSGARALAVVPLLVDDEIIGSITLRQSGEAREWTSSEIELAEAVADQAAIAVQQAKLYQTTKQQAIELEIEKQKIRELNNYLTESVLKRFLPEAIVNKAAMGKLSLDLTPEPRCITILFCDLVGFTNLSSQLEALTLAEILNEYLEAMSKAVFDRGGTVDKFIGDGVMAMFGAPEELPRLEQATRAIATARTMYYYLQKLNERWQFKVSQTDFKVPLLKMRCGIHQGKAVVGMFGGRQRKDYTAIGKVVNIAARLQSVTSPGSILISEAVAKSLDRNINWGKGQNFQLKGIEPDFRAFTIPICDYSGVDSDVFRSDY